MFQMNLGLYNSEFDGDSRYELYHLYTIHIFILSFRFGENARGLDDSRLLDAAETLVTLQTSDLGSGSNNPLFSSGLGNALLPGMTVRVSGAEHY